MKTLLRSMIGSLTVICTLMTLAAATSAGQAATKHDFKFFVSSTVGLVPGQTGFLKAAILNTGSVPAKFKRYDPTNPIGGYGWDFNHPGLALGFFDFTLFGSDFQHFSKAEGHVDPIVPKGPFGEPDFSNVSNVVIHPGELLVFDLMSFLLEPTVPLGKMLRVRTAIEIDIGRPLFISFESDYLSVDITATDEPVTGTLQEIPLTPSSFAP
jgi:hypothetical protein